MKLKDKVAIVTGGARDIGSAVSEKLAAEGARVAVNYFGSEEGPRPRSTRSYRTAVRPSRCAVT